MRQRERPCIKLTDSIYCKTRKFDEYIFQCKGKHLYMYIGANKFLHTHLFEKHFFFFCLLNPATGFYFVFDQARKHIGFDFLSYIGKLSMEIINLLLYHQSVERNKRHLWIMFCLLLVKKLELSDFEFDIATVIKPVEFLDETGGKNESHHL